MNNIILTATLIVAFFMCIGAYCLGLKHGKQLSNNIIPKVQLNPIKAVVEVIEQHEQSKEETKAKDTLDDMMTATKESMLDAIKKVR